MITIEKSLKGGYFIVDGIEYPKNHYRIIYDNKEAIDSEKNISLCSVYDNSYIFKSRGYLEFTGCNSLSDLLLLLSYVGAIKTNDFKLQDQATEIIDLHFSKEVQLITLNNNYSIDDRLINISAGTFPVVGNIVCLKEDTAFYQGEILSVSNTGGNNYDITIDTPLDYAFTVAGGCSERIINMAVDGSVTPQIFSISPANLQSGVEWDITRIIGGILDQSPMDDALFGGITKLANGIVIRKKDGIYKNLFNAKTNGDLKAHIYDVIYSSKAPAGFYGMNFRRTFSGQEKNGVVIRLNADNLDELQIIIQDNLTALDDFQLIAQGHLVEV